MAGSSELSKLDAASMSALISSTLDDFIYNIVSDTILKVHRDEKLARMQSVAIIAQESKQHIKEGSTSEREPQAVTMSGATIEEDGKIYLRGNPLQTTTEILCPVCKLPRLLYPTTGKNSQVPDSGKEYCARHPYISKDGCDIYGKSLVLEEPSKNKSKAKSKAGPSQDASDSPIGSPTNGKGSGEPAATSVPSGKCPNCPRYMSFTRIAQHMDRCVLKSGRESSKNAMTKISNTPGESRATTPKPGATNNNKRKPEKGSEESEEGTPQKKKKKPIAKNTTKESKTSPKTKASKTLPKDKASKALPKDKAVNSNLQRVKSAEKRLPGQQPAANGTRDKDTASSGKEDEAKKRAPSETKPAKDKEDSA